MNINIGFKKTSDKNAHKNKNIPTGIAQPQLCSNNL